MNNTRKSPLTDKAALSKRLRESYRRWRNERLTA
jgi:hypothetical protein